MVKICPNCGTKNFDDEKKCRKCNWDIKQVNVKQDEFTKEFQGMTPRGATPQPWEGRIYSKLAFTLAIIYAAFFFIYPHILVLLLISVLALIFSKISIKNGDEVIGKYALIISIIILLISITEIILTIIVI